jgi:hypothetical protein
MAEKIYFNGAFLKESKFGITLEGKANEIIAEIQKHTKGNGRIKLEILKRKEADKNGNTHYMVVDTWQPQSRNVEDAVIVEDLPF